MADNVLLDGVRSVSDLIVKPGIVNLDFADVRTLMTLMGKAMMGTGEGEGETRALDAANRAIANPLLDDMSLDGAQGVLINVSGGLDVTLYEVDVVANQIRNKVDPDANIIFGSSIEEDMDGAIRVSVVATGIDADKMARPTSPMPGGPSGTPPTGGLMEDQVEDRGRHPQAWARAATRPPAYSAPIPLWPQPLRVPQQSRKCTGWRAKRPNQPSGPIPARSGGSGCPIAPRLSGGRGMGKPCPRILYACLGPQNSVLSSPLSSLWVKTLCRNNPQPIVRWLHDGQPQLRGRPPRQFPYARGEVPAPQRPNPLYLTQVSRPQALIKPARPQPMADAHSAPATGAAKGGLFSRFAPPREGIPAHRGFAGGAAVAAANTGLQEVAEFEAHEAYDAHDAQQQPHPPIYVPIWTDSPPPQSTLQPSPQMPNQVADLDAQPMPAPNPDLHQARKRPAWLIWMIAQAAAWKTMMNLTNLSLHSCVTKTIKANSKQVEPTCAGNVSAQ